MSGKKSAREAVAATAQRIQRATGCSPEQAKSKAIAAATRRDRKQSK